VFFLFLDFKRTVEFRKCNRLESTGAHWFGRRRNFTMLGEFFSSSGNYGPFILPDGIAVEPQL
jgi:hypothetical protein